MLRETKKISFTILRHGEAPPGYLLQVRPPTKPTRFGPRLNEGSRKAELSASIPCRT